MTFFSGACPLCNDVLCCTYVGLSKVSVRVCVCVRVGVMYVLLVARDSVRSGLSPSWLPLV